MILSPVIRQRFFDASGRPLAGGKLYSYAAGTTTPQATYTNSTGTSNTNPVVLDANGEAALWLDPAASYKFVLKDSSDVTQWTVDNASGLLADGVVVTAKLADGSVTTVKIADLAVTSAKLANDASIDANRAVTTNHIRDGAVTAAKMAANAVATTNILDSSVTTAKLADGSVTNVKRASLGQQVSSSSGAASVSSNTYADLTNLTVTITTTGRPVLVFLQPDGTTGTSTITSGGSANKGIGINRGGTVIAHFQLAGTSVGWAPGSISFLDTPAAGTYTYKIQAKDLNAGSAAVGIQNSVLVALEL